MSSVLLAIKGLLQNLWNSPAQELRINELQQWVLSWPKTFALQGDEMGFLGLFIDPPIISLTTPEHNWGSSLPSPPVPPRDWLRWDVLSWKYFSKDWLWIAGCFGWLEIIFQEIVLNIIYLECNVIPGYILTLIARVEGREGYMLISNQCPVSSSLLVSGYIPPLADWLELSLVFWFITSYDNDTHC